MHSALIHKDAQIEGSDTQKYLKTVLTPRLFKQACPSILAAPDTDTGAADEGDNNNNKSEYKDPLLHKNPLQELFNLRKFKVTKSVCPKDRCMLHRVMGYLKEQPRKKKNKTDQDIHTQAQAIDSILSEAVDVPPVTLSATPLDQKEQVKKQEQEQVAVSNSSESVVNSGGGEATTSDPSTVPVWDYPLVMTTAQVVMEVVDTVEMEDDVPKELQKAIEISRTSICVYHFETCLAKPDYEWKISKVDFMVL